MWLEIGGRGFIVSRAGFVNLWPRRETCRAFDKAHNAFLHSPTLFSRFVRSAVFALMVRFFFGRSLNLCFWRIPRPFWTLKSSMVWCFERLSEIRLIGMYLRVMKLFDYVEIRLKVGLLAVFYWKGQSFKWLLDRGIKTK